MSVALWLRLCRAKKVNYLKCKALQPVLRRRVPAYKLTVEKRSEQDDLPVMKRRLAGTQLATREATPRCCSIALAEPSCSEPR
jgi:hypothetical protein